jgi:RimJ/RimL family protein N-acetyltransferase
MLTQNATSATRIGVLASRKKTPIPGSFRFLLHIWRKRIATLVRLVREDHRGLLRILKGRREKMVVFAADLDNVEIAERDDVFVFRPLADEDLRKLAMPEALREEQMARMARFGANSAYGVFCDTKLAHISWLYDRELEGRVPPRYLDLRPDEAEISACVTLPEFRGKGLFRIAIQNISQVARKNGMRRIYMKTIPSNEASQRGIEKAGLKCCGEVIRIVLPLLPSGHGLFLRLFQRSSR